MIQISKLEKKCSKCKKIYPATTKYFQKDKSKSDGLYSSCKKCCNVQAHIYLKDPKYKAKKKKYDAIRRKTVRPHLKELYGITLSDYNKIWKKQNGVCAICGKPEMARNQFGLKRLAVDHNHVTGKVRGLLCQKCNQTLGLINEDVNILETMIKFLIES